MDEIEIEIKKFLPNIDEITLKRLLDKLIELGVSHYSELSLVVEADLKDVLKTIQARLLVRNWTNSRVETNEVQTSEVPASNSTFHQAVVLSPVQVTHKEPDDLDWAYNFEVEWSKMPKNILKPLEEGQRPAPSLRRKMIQIITNDMRNICLKPGRMAISVIARKIVKKYPLSLVDMIGDQKVGEGHSSLQRQMEVRFDNLNRVSPFNILKRTLKDKSNGATLKTLTNADMYGCINWQLPQLPIHETEETQKSKKLAMFTISKQRTIDEREIKSLLQETYYSQRLDINSKTDIMRLKEEWPLLFRKEGMLCHFKILMEFDIVQKLNEALESKGHRLFNFLKKFPIKKQEKEVREILDSSNANEEDPDLATLINLLAIYFSEDAKVLFTVVDVNMTDKDIEDMKLPSTPHLICYGADVFTATHFTIMIDGKVVLMNSVATFMEGFTLLFLSFYVFNIHYPKEAAVTLEFVQRCFLGINPNRGSKANHEVKKKESVNIKILKLLNKMSETEFFDA